MATASTPRLASSAIARARVPRAMPCRAPGPLPLLLTLIALGALAAAFSAAALALFSATLLREAKQVAKLPPVVAPPPPMPSPPRSQTLDAALLRDRIAAAQNSASHLDVALVQVRERMASLDQRRTELQNEVEQRRAAISQAEDDARRSAADQKEAAARRERLLAEAAQLQSRIKDLNATIAEAERAARAQVAAVKNEPQLVECAGDAVILEPQQLRIPMASLNNGALASAVRSHGVYFIVRPDGFNAFVLARAIAHGTGAFIIAEPRAKD